MLNHAFKLRPSKIYLTIAGMVYLLAVLVILYLPLSIVWHIGLFGLATYYAWSIVQRYGLLLHSGSILSVARDGDNLWRVGTTSEEMTAILDGESTITHLVSILCFRTVEVERKLSCVIFSDSLPADQYRKLLVTLRMF